MAESPSDAGARRSGTTPFDVSEYHRLRSPERRRLLLDVLTDRPTPATLETVATEVLEREAADDPTGAETIEHFEVALHHNHLPRLADAGLVEYDLVSTRVVGTRDEFSS